MNTQNKAHIMSNPIGSSIQQQQQQQNSNSTIAQNNAQNNSNKIDDLIGQSKDANTMISILKDMGIEEFEPRVVNQLLGFSYRYITNLLEDAKAFSIHANKKTIDSEDIKLAIKSKVDYSFTTTPPRDLLMEISKSKNKNPLPPIKYHTGIRLPPDRFCLHSQNFTLKTQTLREQQQQQLINDQIYQNNRSNLNQSASKINRNDSFMSSGQASNSTTTAAVMAAAGIKRQRIDDDDYDI